MRLDGWRNAWTEIFAMLDQKSDKLDDQIDKKSEELWEKNQYSKNEEDRVVLFVSLKAKKNKEEIFHES